MEKVLGPNFQLSSRRCAFGTNEDEWRLMQQVCVERLQACIRRAGEIFGGDQQSQHSNEEREQARRAGVELEVIGRRFRPRTTTETSLRSSEFSGGLQDRAISDLVDMTGDSPTFLNSAQGQRFRGPNDQRSASKDRATAT